MRWSARGKAGSPSCPTVNSPSSCRSGPPDDRGSWPGTRAHLVGTGLGRCPRTAGTAGPQPAAPRPGLRPQRQRRLADDEWDQVLEAISAQLGHAAAMLDGELPPEVAADVAAAGLDLLPGAGEVGPRCSCPDEADPCKHSAAVCYLVADALDVDPFAVLLLRGRTRGEVLAGLRARRRDARAGAGQAREAAALPGAAAGTPVGRAGTAVLDDGVDARSALAPAPAPGPIPVPPMPPARPGHPAALPVDPPSWRAGLREDLLALAADAAGRAWQLAVGLDADADLARRAARTLGT